MMTSGIEYQIDLVADYARVLKGKLQTLGFPTDPSADPKTICFMYHNLIRRLIAAQKRRIHKSAEFSCPEVYREGLEASERDIANGNDLTPRLSKLIKTIDYNDDLINDWGIHHIHLGLALDKDGFVQRTEYLLFASFAESDAYLIGVFRHGDWSKQEIIRTVHRNWPELIATSRLTYVQSVSSPVSDEDIKVLRKGHINTVIEVEQGVVYCSIGGGVTCSGIATEVVENYNLEFMQLRKYEEEIRHNIVEIAGRISREIGNTPQKLQFNLAFVDGRTLVREYNTGMIVLS